MEVFVIRLCGASSLLICAVVLEALSQSPPPVVQSPDVHPDHRVTFRVRAPNATEVMLAREGAADRIPMRNLDGGVWTVTTEPLEPDLYGYAFVIDGVTVIDPSNSLIKPNLL